MKSRNWAAIFHFHSLFTNSAVFKICELLLRKIELRQKITNPSHERTQTAESALNDFVKEFFPRCLTVQRGPPKAVLCDVTGKMKDIFVLLTQHWPQGCKEGTRKL